MEQILYQLSPIMGIGSDLYSGIQSTPGNRCYHKTNNNGIGCLAYLATKSRNMYPYSPMLCRMHLRQILVG
ncbi:MAG: hypothetical protein WA116_02895 [Anaerolineaceae bacterium]